MFAPPLPQDGETVHRVNHKGTITTAATTAAAATAAAASAAGSGGRCSARRAVAIDIATAG